MCFYDVALWSNFTTLHFRKFTSCYYKYAAPALTLEQKQIDELNACWNNVFRKIFGYRRSESVKDVIYGLGRVNFKYLLLLRTVKFYKRLILNQAYCMMYSGRP